MSVFDEYRFLAPRVGAVTAARRFVLGKTERRDALSRLEALAIVCDLGNGKGSGNRSALIALAEMLGDSVGPFAKSVRTSYLLDRVVAGVECGELILFRRWRWPEHASHAGKKPPPPEPVRAAPTARPVNAVRYKIELWHRYHDDEPVQSAEFKVRLADGSTRTGTLNKSGRAVVEDVPDGPASVQLGPDARKYELINREKSPDYKASLAPSDIDALIELARADS